MSDIELNPKFTPNMPIKILIWIFNKIMKKAIRNRSVVKKCQNPRV